MFSIAIIISFILITFFASISIMCFNTDFYRYEYAKNNVAEKINISDNDLMKATDVLLGYIKNSNDSLDVDVKIGDNIEKMFNQREIDHMVDVKNLYLNVRNISFIGLLVFACSLFIILNDELPFTRIYDSAIKTYSVLSGIIGCLLLYACVDFNSFWTNFHKVFFRNDLWLLDPRTDRMILMVPSGFFFDLIIMIVIIFVLANFQFFFVLRYKSRKEIKL